MSFRVISGHKLVFDATKRFDDLLAELNGFDFSDMEPLTMCDCEHMRRTTLDVCGTSVESLRKTYPQKGFKLEEWLEPFWSFLEFMRDAKVMRDPKGYEKSYDKSLALFNCTLHLLSYLEKYEHDRQRIYEDLRRVTTKDFDADVFCADGANTRPQLVLVVSNSRGS